jgi:hypothetical protein
MKAAGRWAWWNQYIQEDLRMTVERCIERAKQAKLDGVIVKAGYWGVSDQFKRAGIRVGVEAYCKPHRTQGDADLLIQGIQRGAEFAVVNAETEWEQPNSGEQMRQLCNRFIANCPNTELYASVDTRGSRMLLSYQQVLLRYITGWMPMIYPKAFYPHKPVGFIRQAFIDCIEGKDFNFKPVLPTIQVYGGVGANNVQTQISWAKRMLSAPGQPLSYYGYQAYTIGHATDAEWDIISADAPVEETEDSMKDQWLDSTIVGLDGIPLLFNVLQADMSFKADIMTYRRWLTLKALGFLESDHSHTATVKMN